MTDPKITALARQIMDMAERDKGLTLAALEEVISLHAYADKAELMQDLTDEEHMEWAIDSPTARWLRIQRAYQASPWRNKSFDELLSED